MSRRLRPTALLTASLAVPVLAALAGISSSPPSANAGRNLLNGPSPAVGVHAFLARPSIAPKELRGEFKTARRALATRHRRARASHLVRDGVFNRDTAGLPQNEESVSGCRSRP